MEIYTRKSIQRQSHKKMIEDLKIKLAQEGEIFLKVKVRVGAGKAEIKKIMADGAIKIDLRHAPVRGKANKELVYFFARQFSIPEKNVKIINGLSNKIKLIRLFNNL